jgi:Ca2+-binding RTX toxin-like protein
MAVKNFNTSSMGSGVQGELGMHDSGIVSQNTILASTDDNGVEGTGSHQSLTVFGTVMGEEEGVLLGGDFNGFKTNRDVHIVVGEEGYVAGGVGVVMLASASDVNNRGTISGSTFGLGVGGWDMTTKVSVNNSGTILGQLAAVEFIGRSDSVLNNSGIIKGAVDCGNIQNMGSFGGIGDVMINNTGKIIGSDIFGAVLLGTGNDTYNGKGGTVHGVVFGGAGNDKLIGGDKAEFLEGGSGADKSTGNGGADHFVFSSISDSKVNPASMDVITDFHHKQHDVIDVSDIDADISDADDNAFFFEGTHKFRGFAGEIRYDIGKRDTMIYGDIDGDKHADFEIELSGRLHLVKGDFDL